MATISSIFADFVKGTRYESLSTDTVQHSKKVILDFIGVSLAGYQSMDFPRMVVDYVLDLGGKPEATVIHSKRKIPAIHAAFANASCAHALDMDDGHRFANGHPGVVTIPPAVALAAPVYCGEFRDRYFLSYAPGRP